MITGEKLHEAMLSVIPDADSEQTYTVLNDETRQVLIATAAVLHQQEVQPLQELVMAYRRQLATRPFVSVWAEDFATVANWIEENAKLEERARALLREEVK